MSTLSDPVAELDFIKVVLSMGEESPGRLHAESVTDGVDESCFTDKFLWKCYQAAKECARKGNPSTQEVIGAIIGPSGRDKLSYTYPAIPIFGGYKEFSTRLKEYSARRAAREIAKRILEASENTSVDMAGSLVHAAAALQGAYKSDGSSIVSGVDVLHKLVEEMEYAQGNGQAPCLASGIEEWDSAVGGLARGVVTVIASMPGIGKTAVAATMAGNLSFNGTPTGYISLEDNPTSIARRYLSRETGISVADITRRKLREYEMERIGSAWDGLGKICSNLYFDGRSALNSVEVAASCRFMIAEKQVKVVFIDLLTEIKATQQRKDRYDLEVGEAVSLLRDVAKDTNTPIVVLAHLRRGNEDGDEAVYRVPSITSFADSAAIERRSKVAVGIYQSRDGAFLSGIVLKNRDGPPRVKFNLERHVTSGLVKNVNTRQPNTGDNN